MFDQLIADAKVAYESGHLKPARGVYCREGFACVFGAAWSFHHEFRKPAGDFIGKWAVKFYGLPPDQAQGFVHGWDGYRSEVQQSAEYLEGYRAGEDAAILLVG